MTDKDQTLEERSKKLVYEIMTRPTGTTIFEQKAAIHQREELLTQALSQLQSETLERAVEVISAKSTCLSEKAHDKAYSAGIRQAYAQKADGCQIAIDVLRAMKEG